MTIYKLFPVLIFLTVLGCQPQQSNYDKFELEEITISELQQAVTITTPITLSF